MDLKERLKQRKLTNQERKSKRVVIDPNLSNIDNPANDSVAADVDSMLRAMGEGGDCSFDDGVQSEEDELE